MSMPKLKPKYTKLLDQFENEIDMCNQLGLNLDEIYEDEDDIDMVSQDDIDGVPQDMSYEEWLEETGLEDTSLNRGWFDCPDEERAEYIRKHKSWWKTFGEV